MLSSPKPLQQILQASSTLEHLHGFRSLAVQNGLHTPLLHVPLQTLCKLYQQIRSIDNWDSVCRPLSGITVMLLS